MIETTYLLGAMFVTSEVLGVMRVVHANGIMHFVYLCGKSILGTLKNEYAYTPSVVESVAAFLDDARSVDHHHTRHGARHGDTPHGTPHDTWHGDTPHGDTPHGGTRHGDTRHGTRRDDTPQGACHTCLDCAVTDDTPPGVANPQKYELWSKQGRTARHHARHHARHDARHHAHNVRHARRDRHVSLDLGTDS